MRKGMTLGLVLAVLAGLMLTSCEQQSPSFRGTVLKAPVSAPDFILTDQHGQSFRLSEQRGRVVLLYFGYTHCPGACPLTLSKWTHIREALGADAERVRFVFITVDPERDRSQRLQQHLATFNADFIGLTGTQVELESVYRAYGVFREKASVGATGKDYLVNHNTSAFVIDPDGLWRLRHASITPPEDIIHDVRQLLKRTQL